MRNFENVKKIVIKIGTNTLTKPNTIEIDTEFIGQIADQIVNLLKKSIQAVIVTSGAIGMGAGRLGIKEKITDPRKRQACAAIGQPLLMQAYEQAFRKHKVTVGQVLLTSDVLEKATTYKNLRNVIDELFNDNVVPILNENDCISTEEIGTAFGDNDRLSALVASKIDANLLIMLTDIDALYDRDPKENGAKPIRTVEHITPEIQSSAGQSNTKFGTGGMHTKIAAVSIAFDAGCKIVIARGRERNVLPRIINGEDIGTVFIPTDIKKREYWDRWILNIETSGSITVATEEFKKIRKELKRSPDKRSPDKKLYPRWILNVEGSFQRGAAITINSYFKGVSQLSSNEIKMWMGKTQRDIKEEIGKGEVFVAQYKEIVPIKENMI
jgi:glutamate 5-kinase